VQKVTAPALRLQLTNEIAQLARVGEGDIGSLLELPRRPSFSRPAPRAPRYDAPTSPEWSLLTALLADLSLVEHIDAAQLDPARAETRALLAVREKWEAADEELSFPLLIEALSGNPCLETLLKAQRYAEDLGFEVEAARSEFQHALVQVDLRHRKTELDRLRGKLTSKEDLVAFQEKNLAYKRLQGALPSA